MKVRCPHCGNEVQVNGLGRPKLNIPLKNICDALRLHRGQVSEAAKELGCSPGYIFNLLKVHGLKLKDIN
jgi:hypothetical protein